MIRRTFIAASSLAVAAQMNASGAEEKKEMSERQFLEWRKYILMPGPRKDAIHAYLREAAIPAMNRQGIKPIGAFTATYGPNDPSLYVLIPHPNLESIMTLGEKLRQDEEYLKASEPYTNAPFDNPVYLRMESQLLFAFTHMPTVETPVPTGVSSRIFELRIYESHSKKYGKKKMEMFNEGGEIEIFRKTGLHPVFFGETIIGDRMPNLTYMLAFENMAERDKNWSTFVSSPEWKELSGDKQYADTVSNITDFILRPTNYSQI